MDILFWPVTNKKEREKIIKGLNSGIERRRDNDSNIIIIKDDPVTYYVKLDNLMMLKYIDNKKL